METLPDVMQRPLNADGTATGAAARGKGVALRADPAGPGCLADAAVAWLAALPDEARPHRLPRDFPRIVNRLSELWRFPSRCEAYLTQLILDDRGDRRGFAPAIMKELGALAAHYAGAHPARPSPWFDQWKR